ncbi:tail fiber assembly protein [Yokenella regensburgei]|uniref:tail fiber assembly protein n=1 Tax=Yokenella regensburgei TaxID=158877 RepID=UPI00024229EC|nr:tail assembly chaperone [Yokenella regensburgei]EHM50736.1 caudovirales tail fiber assembly protein [Yokenella regensburgei ATCC 43003]
MSMHYSASKNMFYDGSLKDSYIAGSGWPRDCLKVSEGMFRQYVDPAPAGKVRVAGPDGFPAWGDVPAPTPEQMIAAAEAEKQSRISQANDYMNGKQWPGKAAIGRLKGDELAQYNLWIDYLDALQATKTSTAPDIRWPVSPEK